MGEVGVKGRLIRRVTSGSRLRAGLRCANAAKEPGDTDVFVEIGPMDSLSIAEQFEMAPLLRCRVEQSREPDQRHGDRTLPFVRSPLATTRYGLWKDSDVGSGCASQPRERQQEHQPGSVRSR